MPNINNVPTTQYIGPRIIPHFADPAEWSITREYDALSIVTQGGNTYWAKTNVPAGIQITNTTYWFLSAYPDAQIQQYRAEVQAYAQEVEGFAGQISSLQTTVAGHTTSLNSLDTRVDDLEETVDVLKTPKHAVFVGDSFTSAYYLLQEGATERDRWCYKVAKSLGVTPHIYAERGAGFTRLGVAQDGGHNFTGMLGVARDDAAFANKDVAWVFVYGGLNDINHENADTAFGSSAPTFYTTAKSFFPNAQLVVCGINAWPEGFSFYKSGDDYRSQVFYEYQMKTNNSFLNANAIFISMCGALGFTSSYYYSNNRHPNPLGNNALAAWILSAMNGTPLTKSKLGTVHLKSAPSTNFGKFQLHIQPGALEVMVTATASSIGTDAYMADSLGTSNTGTTIEQGLMSDAGIAIVGTPIVYEGQGSAYVGNRDTDGYTHVNGRGYFRFQRLW